MSKTTDKGFSGIVENRSETTQLCLVQFEGFDGLRHLCDKPLNENRQHFEKGPHFCNYHKIGEGPA